MWMTAGRESSPRGRFLLLVQILFCLSGFSIQLISGSISDYVDEYLSTPDICPPISSWLGWSSSLTKEKIRLGNFPNNTVIVKLTRGQGNDILPPSLLNFRCKFQVTAPKGFAVMVVIRTLYLRSDGKDQCIDFLQFKREGNYKTREICGSVNSNDKSEEPHDLIGPRYFNDYIGSMEITFSTGSAKESEQIPLVVEMVFTAYTQCPGSRKTTTKYGQCSNVACITAPLVCDGVINCGGVNDFGKDEEGCAEIPEAPSRAMSIFIFGLTAIATLLVVVVFILIGCCCMKRFNNWKPCFRPNENRRNSAREQEFSLNMSDSSPPINPTAPPSQSTGMEWRSTTPNAPKLEDLPPSYKDLFPEERISTKT